MKKIIKFILLLPAFLYLGFVAWLCKRLGMQLNAKAEFMKQIQREKEETVTIDIEPLSFKVFGEKAMLRFLNKELKKGKRELILSGDLL